MHDLKSVDDVKHHHELLIPCPRDRADVPIWYCLGSFIQGREGCPYILEAKIYYGRRATVKCSFPLTSDGKLQSFTPKAIKDG